MRKQAWIRRIYIICCFSNALFLIHCHDKNPTKSENTPPTASFKVTPYAGTIETNFNFDASDCSDKEDKTSDLQVRWDWENDGIWDTEYSTLKTATHLYLSVGTKIIVLETKDTSGLISSAAIGIGVIMPTVQDIDGNIYKTVKIGNQWWMAENLKVTHYRNGDPIPYVAYLSKWNITHSGAYCDYDNEDKNALIYGHLYNAYAVRDSRGIAPDGWHMPSAAEWQILIDYLGGELVAGGKMKEGGYKHWLSPNTGATNESGFNALPGGDRVDPLDFFGLGSHAAFYASTYGESSVGLYNYSLYFADATIKIGPGALTREFGMSIRCVRDYQ